MSAVRTVYRWCAVIVAALALVPGYYAVRLGWAPKVDFDVIGLLWLLQNVPRLTAIGLTLGALVGAGVLWTRSSRY
jgi:hypothetical protein